MTAARGWHFLTAVTAIFALVLQFVLIWNGHVILVDDEAMPPLGERVIRYFGYFTILSNAAVAVACWTLAFGRDSNSTAWRLLRLDGLIGITVTFLVVQILLSGIIELHGVDLLADRLLHVVVPLMAILGWVLFGPRERIQRRDLLLSLVAPVLWLVYTLVRGAIVDWYPYPFLDAGEIGYGPVALYCLGISALFVGLAALAWKLDGWLARTRLGA